MTGLKSWVAAVLATVSMANTVFAEPPLAVPAFGPQLDDGELVGLPRGNNAELLIWERAYALALVASRGAPTAQGSGLREALDPVDLAERASRAGVADFARFRADFFASSAGTGKAQRTFRDPSGDMFELIRRLQAVVNVRRSIVAHEQFLTYVRERLEGESSGLTQLDLDRVDIGLQQARRSLLASRSRYRDKLDQFKVELGLSPHAPITLDRGSLAAFDDVFGAIGHWQQDSNRDVQDLPLLVDRLPKLDDVVIDGRPVIFIENSAAFEDALSVAARIAIKNRRDLAVPQGSDPAAVQLELQVRRRIRNLLEIHLAYLIEGRTLLLLTRAKDQAFERLVAPASDQPSQPRSLGLKDLLELHSQDLESRDRLVGLWAAFHAERLVLYRDLGTMPCSDWKSFYEQFSAKPSDIRQGPLAPPAPPLLPPPP